MAVVHWALSASRYAESIIAYVAQDSERAARAFLGELRHAARRLESFLMITTRSAKGR